tara:strand:+ start:213 stop:353 length:141 start_codon:yes stop_codon:yes gene_type:complete
LNIIGIEKGTFTFSPSLNPGEILGRRLIILLASASSKGCGPLYLLI